MSAEANRPAENVLTEYPVSDTLTMYQIHASSGKNVFQLYDRAADAVIPLDDWVYRMEFREIVSEDCIIFYTTGENTEWAGRNLTAGQPRFSMESFLRQSGGRRDGYPADPERQCGGIHGKSTVLADFTDTASMGEYPYFQLDF